MSFLSPLTRHGDRRRRVHCERFAACLTTAKDRSVVNFELGALREPSSSSGMLFDEAL